MKQFTHASATISTDRPLVLLVYFYSGFYAFVGLGLVAVHVISLVIETGIWCDEVIEGVELSRRILETVRLTDQFSFNSQGKAVPTDSMVPYVDLSKSSWSLAQDRIKYLRQANVSEKIVQLYTAYVNFRLLARFIKNDCKEMTIMAKAVLETYSLALIFFQSTNMSATTRLNNILFYILCGIATLHCQSQLIQIILLDLKVGKLFWHNRDAEIVQ